MKKSTLTVFFIMVGCMLFLSGIWIYFQKKLDQVDLGEGEGASSYAKHYLMIFRRGKYPDVGFHL